MTQLFTPVESIISRHDRAMTALKAGINPDLPAHVADALNIFCHEKLRRWRSKNWFWAEEPRYDQVAKNIGNGSFDRVKQNALYVGIGEEGITSTPSSTEAEARESIETAKMLKEVAEGNDRLAFAEKECVTYALKSMLHEFRGPRS